MPFLETEIGKLLMTFLLSMTPVLELRGAIPAGIAAGLHPVVVYLTAVVGNLLPAPFIILLIRRIFDWFRDSPRFGSKVVALERRAHLKGRMVQPAILLGLLIAGAITTAVTLGLIHIF